MQKLTKYFRMSITDQCTLSCYFCHNEGQCQSASAEKLTAEDFIWVCGQMKSIGFEKFKITGGEPTLRKDLPEIIRGIKKHGIDDVSIITNGTLLKKSLPKLMDAGLKRLNISLYSLNKDKFSRDNGGSSKQLESIKAGIDIVLENGFHDTKLNYVFHGSRDIDELERMLSYASDKNLILVILPLIPISIREGDENTSLQELRAILSIWGIEKEIVCQDKEGISKRFITMKSGATVLLRDDELSVKLPYKDCITCSEKSECREGIFPLRMTSIGEFIPCLAGGVARVSARTVIKARDSKKLLKLVKGVMER